MRRIVAGINMTLDGFCDHTSISPDDEIHQHYADLLESAGVVLYGRITYQLMQFWQNLVQNPSGDRSMDGFATAMDRVPKIVFSRTLTTLDWKSAKLADGDIEEEVLELKQQAGNDILVGSRSIIIQLMALGLVDELQLCIHPVIAGSGLPLFDGLENKTFLKLTKTKTFSGGAIVLYYQPEKADHE